MRDKQKYVIETKDVLEDKDLITQGFLCLSNIVRSSNSSPGSLLTFSTLQIVLCVFPNSKRNLILRFTSKQSINVSWSWNVWMRILRSDLILNLETHRGHWLNVNLVYRTFHRKLHLKCNSNSKEVSENEKKGTNNLNMKV